MNIDIFNGIETNSLIKIALVPGIYLFKILVGKINSKTFNEVAIKIQKNSTISINHLSRFNKDNSASPFSNYNWSKGVLKIKYVDGRNLDLEFTEMQQHKKIHGVLFIINIVDRSYVL
jgi:hypothetical protein